MKKLWDTLKNKAKTIHELTKEFPHKTYEMIDHLRKQLVANTTLSRSQTISILVNEKTKKLNGKTKQK